MAIDIKIPELGESISEAQIGSWLVKEGDTVTKDQNLVSIESEKATLEIAAPEAGVIGKILQPDGATVKVGDVIGHIEAFAGKTTVTKTEELPVAKPEVPASVTKTKAAKKTPSQKGKSTEVSTAEEKPDAPQPDNQQEKIEVTAPPIDAEEKEVPLGNPTDFEELEAEPQAEPTSSPASRPAAISSNPSRREEVKPMSQLRRTVAKRLVEAQQNMAILTTFNEIDMSAVIALRKKYQETFHEKAGVKLGFMSFFVKAVIEALKIVPQLNAEIRGNDIVYHHYFDIGVAIGAGKGLVVPPIRDAERLRFAEIEKIIADLGSRAKENKLKPQELAGGTFTISNGGIYGSLLSTPIINPPQSGILGLHTIQERPIARDGQVVICPMMYVALSYDHRIVDGREAVQFLLRIKEIIEDPMRLMLEV